MPINGLVPKTYFLEDAANLARGSIMARLDPALTYQPFFRLDLGGEVPAALHASWDYCDMAGRFVDALILTARTCPETHVQAAFRELAAQVGAGTAMADCSYSPVFPSIVPALVAAHEEVGALPVAFGKLSELFGHFRR